MKNRLPRAAKAGELVAIDIEIFGMKNVDKLEGEFACLSISYGSEDETYQIYDSKKIPETLSRIGQGMWVFQNAIFDIRHLRRWAVISPRPIHDTMLVERALFGGYYDFFSLDDLCRRWLNTFVDKGPQKEFETATEMTPELKKYAALDAILTLQVAKKQIEYIKEYEEEFRTYTMADARSLWSIIDINPVKVDVESWNKILPELEQKGIALEEKLGFNSKSVPATKNAIKAVFKSYPKDTNAKTLETMMKNAQEKGNEKGVELLTNILGARMYRDAGSKYGKNWLENFVDEDGLVRASWHISGAETGRMSCSNPNLMQIPARDMPIYRTFFVPTREAFIIADVSQQEPCIMASFSRDKELIEAIKSGRDIHLEVARRIFNDPTMTKDDPRRFIGKTINLGSAYGLSEFGLATRLNISEDEAKSFLTQYFNRFSGVKSWIDRQRAMAERLGYVRTALGRKIWINPHNYQWKNNAINGPIQGTAAEQTKIAISNLHDLCIENDIYFPLVLVIHDEVVLDVNKEDVSKYKQLLNKAWEGASNATVSGLSAKLEIFVGPNWGAKK